MIGPCCKFEDRALLDHDCVLKTLVRFDCVCSQTGFTVSYFMDSSSSDAPIDGVVSTGRAYYAT